MSGDAVLGVVAEMEIKVIGKVNIYEVCRLRF
jgi:hypothetical protein